MSNEFLGDRRKVLEDGFFLQQEKRLLARQRDEEQRRAARAALVAASRITDDVLIDQLVAFGITADTLTALSLVPLIEVAWADGQVETAEKEAILAAAQAVGLQADSVGYRLIEDSLSTQPAARLREMWEHYMRTVCATLSAEERQELKNELLQRAHRVAEAAGGFMGIGSKVSSREKALLAEFAQAFEPSLAPPQR